MSLFHLLRQRAGKPVRVGIIGAGMIANLHAKAIAAMEGGELHSFYGRRQEAVDELVAENGGKGYTDLDEFLADEHVQAFAGRLKETFYKSLELAVDFARYLSQGARAQVRVDILPTGGGYNLPMVQEMIRKVPIEWRFNTIAPELLTTDNADFNAVSRQLAVSVGGAVLELPRQVGAVAA